MLSRAASALVLLCGLAVAGGAVADNARVFAAPTGAMVDAMPLWLGAEALSRGQDPLDPKVAEALFKEEKLRLRVGGFYNYYPPTASLFFLPVHTQPFAEVAGPYRILCAAVLMLGAFAQTLAGFSRPRDAAGWARAAGIASAAAGFWLLVRPGRVTLTSGQVGPLVVGLAALAVGLLGFGRLRSAAAIFALGAGLKLAPVVGFGALAARRAWAALGVALAVSAALVLTVMLFGAPIAGGAWLRSLLGFVDLGPLPSWLQHEPPALLTFWRWRSPLALGSAALLGGYALLRPRSNTTAANLALVGLGAIGVVMAGSHHYHEALWVVPVVTHALVWPLQAPRNRVAWVGGALVLAVLVWGRATSRMVPPDSLHWLAMGGVGYAVGLVRAGLYLREEERFDGEVTGIAPEATDPPPTTSGAPTA